MRIIELLQHNGLLGRRGPIRKSIDALSFSQIIDLVEEIKEAATVDRAPAKGSVFSFAASLGLSGSALECAEISCRIRRVNSLARFAVLYSDEVYIHNFLTDSDIDEDDSDVPIEIIKEDLYDNLVVLHEIRPLIEQGYLKLFEPQRNRCFSCQAKEFIGINAYKRFDREYSKLRQEYLKNIQVNLEQNDNETLLDCDGPLPYFEHGQIISYADTPEGLASHPRILKRAQRGLSVPLSKPLIKELGIHNRLAHNVVTNAIHGAATSSSLGTSFLTEHDIHLSFLNSLHYESEIRHRNAIALNQLESIIPFIGDVTLRDVIKVRQREGDAFIAYRQSLNSAIDNFSKAGGIFTEKDARDLHADVIAPSLALLDRKVKQAKRDLISKPLQSLAGMAGAISFGLLTGLVPPNVTAIAQTIGVVKFGADLIQNVMASADQEKEIKNDQFYFLWRIKKITKKR